MFLTMLPVLTTPLARIGRMLAMPVPPPVGGLLMSGVFLAALAAYDLRTRGALHPATAWGAVVETRLFDAANYLETEKDIPKERWSGTSPAQWAMWLGRKRCLNLPRRPASVSRRFRMRCLKAAIRRWRRLLQS